MILSTWYPSWTDMKYRLTSLMLYCVCLVIHGCLYWYWKLFCFIFFPVALAALKRKKRYEKQLQQIDGTLSTIEFQREALENSSTNTEVLKVMGTAAKALKGAHDHLWVWVGLFTESVLSSVSTTWSGSNWSSFGCVSAHKKQVQLCVSSQLRTPRNLYIGDIVYACSFVLPHMCHPRNETNANQVGSTLLLHLQILNLNHKI